MKAPTKEQIEEMEEGLFDTAVLFTPGRYIQTGSRNKR